MVTFTREERQRRVLEHNSQRMGTREISKLLHMSFTDIGKILMVEFHGMVELPAKFTTTAKPSCASLVATARPIPSEASVTMTLLAVDAPAIISYSPWVQGDHRGLSYAE